MEPQINDIQATATLCDQVQKLINRFLGGKQPDFLKRHAQLLDDYFQTAFLNSSVGPQMEINRNPYAIIALGGYGRSEQCIHSDVDLLVLFEKKIPRQADALIREMIYPLWDIGMEVGYATRSLKECLRLAADDFDILTPILDARFICGMSPLYSTLMDRMHGTVIKKKARKIIDWLVDKNHDRHVHFGDSAYLLEPNLKEGQGGLRDYHTILWIARIKHQLKTPRDLEYFGQFSHAEYQALRKALHFIWRIRNWLHHQTGRKRDQLHFEDQLALASALSYTQADGQQPVERFMGELHANMENVKQQHTMFLHEHWLGSPHHRKRSKKSKSARRALKSIPGNCSIFKARRPSWAGPRC